MILGVVVGGFGAVGCSTLSMDAPERTFSLPNDTGRPRLVHRCDWLDDCRSPRKGELVQPGESLEFKIYAEPTRSEPMWSPIWRKGRSVA
jgi:hypothetical protein